MKNLIVILLSLAVVSCSQSSKRENLPVGEYNEKTDSTSLDTKGFGIVIHGGAGYIQKANMTPKKEAEYLAKLEEAIRKGHTILKNGGTSLDAVSATISILEDSPLFNAGKGAVFTAEGTNELDASIMDGNTLNAGAVAGVTTVKNPINLAKKVMSNSPHVMLSGKGAEEFAMDQKLKIVDPKYFYTQERMDVLERVRKEEKMKKTETKAAFYDPLSKGYKFGTVGCVALDQQGNLAAGTSTGGMTNKKWNRIGDSPIIGAGTYANNTTCAVSSTGWGEYFIRGMVAYDISALMEYREISLKEAAALVIQKKLKTLGGDGGIIAIDNKGNVAMEFNTTSMYRATMNASGKLIVAIYGN